MLSLLRENSEVFSIKCSRKVRRNGFQSSSGRDLLFWAMDTLLRREEQGPQYDPQASGRWHNSSRSFRNKCLLIHHGIQSGDLSLFPVCAVFPFVLMSTNEKQKMQNNAKQNFLQNKTACTTISSSNTNHDTYSANNIKHFLLENKYCF